MIRPASGRGRTRHQFGFGNALRGKGIRNFHQTCGQCRHGDQIHLRHRDHGHGHLQQSCDLHMLARLRRDALHGRDDQHRALRAARTRHHGADEILVTGRVNQVERPTRHLAMGKPQRDRQATGFFLGQPVRLNPREPAHQRRLAMIHMADHNHAGRCHVAAIAPSAATISGSSSSITVRMSSHSLP